MLYVSRKLFFWSIIGLSLSLVSCAQKLNESGLPTPAGEIAVTSAFPAVVMVVLPSGSGMCTGTFISRRAVLTAAHCTLTSGNYIVHTSFGDFTTSTRVNLGSGTVNDPNDLSVLVFDTDVADPAQGQVYSLGSSIHTGDTLRLVGYGCSNISTKTGAGIKRTGTNSVANLTDYVEFLTPATKSNGGVQKILGPQNRAGSCFGDSGGPALAVNGNSFEVVAVTHAGGQEGDELVSEYVNVASRTDNRDFLRRVNQDYNLGIAGI